MSAYWDEVARRTRVTFGGLFPLTARALNIQPSMEDIVREAPVANMDWGALIGQGLDVLGSIRGGRRSSGPAAPAMGFMGVPAPYTGGGAGGGGGGYRRHRRGRGITARDLRSFRRVANLIRTYAAPVRHFRTHPKRRGAFGR